MVGLAEGTRGASVKYNIVQRRPRRKDHTRGSCVFGAHRQGHRVKRISADVEIAPDFDYPPGLSLAKLPASGTAGGLRHHGHLRDHRHRCTLFAHRRTTSRARFGKVGVDAWPTSGTTTSCSTPSATACFEARGRLRPVFDRGRCLASCIAELFRNKNLYSPFWFCETAKKKVSSRFPAGSDWAG